MTSTITTEGTTGGPVNTPHVQGQLVRDWVTVHADDVRAAGVKGDDLETTWPPPGTNRTMKTTRDPDEDDKTFINRHLVRVSIQMIDYPPVP